MMLKRMFLTGEKRLVSSHKKRIKWQMMFWTRHKRHGIKRESRACVFVNQRIPFFSYQKRINIILFINFINTPTIGFIPQNALLTMEGSRTLSVFVI